MKITYRIPAPCAVWDLAAEAEIPGKLLLANVVNHPGVEGHEVYAKVLMKLFEE